MFYYSFLYRQYIIIYDPRDLGKHAKYSLEIIIIISSKLGERSNDGDKLVQIQFPLTSLEPPAFSGWGFRTCYGSLDAYSRFLPLCIHVCVSVFGAD